MRKLEGISQEIDAESDKKAHSPEEATEMLRYIIANMAMREETATKEDVSSIRSEMATKEDVKKMIAESEARSKDHTTRECAKTRDTFYKVAYKQDAKTNEFIKVAQKSGTISRADGASLLAINPFVSLPAD